MKKSLVRPLISVIMPVYNAEKYLVEAIESILNQSYHNFEFIIIDDNSSDQSWNIIQRYKKSFPKKIKAYKLSSTMNHGGDACANVGYKKSKGEFIARMDADDIADPSRLEKQVAYMQAHKKVIILGTQAYVIDSAGNIVGEKLEPTSHEEIRKNYFIYHPMIHPSVMIRRSLLPRGELYTIQHSANNDLLTFFSLLRFGKFANLPEKLIKYRIHGNNDSLINPKEKFLNTLKIRIYAWRNLGYTPTLKAWCMTGIQSVVTILLPSSIITSLYLRWKGLSKSNFSFPVSKLAIKIS